MRKEEGGSEKYREKTKKHKNSRNDKNEGGSGKMEKGNKKARTEKQI